MRAGVGWTGGGNAARLWCGARAVFAAPSSGHSDAPPDRPVSSTAPHLISPLISTLFTSRTPAQAAECCAEGLASLPVVSARRPGGSPAAPSQAAATSAQLGRRGAGDAPIARMLSRFLLVALLLPTVRASLSDGDRLFDFASSCACTAANYRYSGADFQLRATLAVLRHFRYCGWATLLPRRPDRQRVQLMATRKRSVHGELCLRHLRRRGRQAELLPKLTCPAARCSA
jgi:hypothetical protein